MNENKRTREELLSENEELRGLVAEFQTKDAAFEASKMRYRRLFETAKDGILILDAETGRIVDANPFILDLLGVSLESLLNKSLWNVGPFEDVLASRASFMELLDKEYIRYEDLPLESSDGRKIDVEFVSNVYLVNGKKTIQCNVRDITDRVREQKREELANKILALLNENKGEMDLVREFLLLVKENTGFEAVGVRLKEGDDFPYYQTIGFPAEFVQAERRLCERDEVGNLVRDEAGNPVLECMCGNVICGRTDPAKPFFTKNGSFWTNSATQLLATTTEADRQARTRNRCNGEGYESVALIPLRSGDRIIGLLQLNDHRPNQFTPDRIHFFEGLGASVGVALSRKQTEDELRQSEETNYLLFANANDVIFSLDANAVFLIVSPSIERVLGHKPEDLIGKTFMEMNLLAPECLDRAVSDTLRAFSGEKVLGAEYTFLAKDGSRRIGEVNTSPIVVDGKVIASASVARDITDRKRAEEAVRNSEIFLNSIIEYSPHAMWISDSQGTLIRLNRACRDLLHITEAEVVGKYNVLQDSIVVDQGHLPLVKQVFEQGATVRFTITYDTARLQNFALGDNVLRILDVTISPVLDANGRLVHAIIQHLDITERRQAEAQKLLMEEQLRHNQKLESLGTLASGVAHEINNPITSILTFAELIQIKAKGDERLADYSARIIKETSRVAAIVKNLLAFARTEKASHSPARLADLVHDTLSLIGAALRRDQIEITVEIPDDLPKIKCRSQQIEQVLMNLIANAQDALNERYPQADENKRLKIACRLIEKDHRFWVRTTVENHGAALPPEIAGRIFDPFFTTKGPGAGTGLGLSISHGIVTEHNGLLSVESGGAEFTKFHLDMPVENVGTPETKG